MIIAVDFDGTIVEHDFPRIGKPLPGAIEWLKSFQEAGALLILLTMRSDGPPQNNRKVLTEAIDYCRENGLEFWQVNDNREQNDWTASRKVYAHTYIDDAAAGVPLKDGSVDWEAIGPLVMGMIEKRKAVTG